MKKLNQELYYPAPRKSIVEWVNGKKQITACGSLGGLAHRSPIGAKAAKERLALRLQCVAVGDGWYELPGTTFRVKWAAEEI
jgi:hypothetical protein